jgi:hypothetical protein
LNIGLEVLLNSIEALSFRREVHYEIAPVDEEVPQAL